MSERSANVTCPSPLPPGECLDEQDFTTTTTTTTTTTPIDSDYDVYYVYEDDYTYHPPFFSDPRFTSTNDRVHVAYGLVAELIKPSHADGSRGVRFSLSSVCLFVRAISQKPMQRGSPNLTYKCTAMVPGNPFWEVKRSRSCTKTVPAWVFTLL